MRRLVNVFLDMEVVPIPDEPRRVTLGRYGPLTADQARRR